MATRKFKWQVFLVVLSFLVAVPSHAGAEVFTYNVTFAQAYTSPVQLPNPAGGTTWYCVNSKWNQPRDVASGSNPHRGTDILLPEGKPVYAIADGVITNITDLGSTWKWRIEQSIAGTVVYFNYVHLGSYAVSNGQNVTKGQLIGYIGTPNHLHMGMAANTTATYSSVIWRSNWPAYTNVSNWRYGKDLDIAADPYWNTTYKLFSLDFYVSTDVPTGGCQRFPLTSATMYHRDQTSKFGFSYGSMAKVSDYRWQFDLSSLYVPGTYVDLTAVGYRSDIKCCTNTTYNWAVFPAKYDHPSDNPNTFTSPPAVYSVYIP